MSTENPSHAAQKYAVQASSLFEFLKESFFKMPVPVQVIGWFVFLLLFVFLVLYPVVGVTYFHGKVITLKVNDQGNPIQPMERGMRVRRGAYTYTNEAGEFTLAVRTPYVPLVKVEFEFGSDDNIELFSLPTPVPFVSMFNPNARKIFYVPNSRVTNEMGTVRRLFLDADEACNAFPACKSSRSTGTPPGTLTGASLFLERLGKAGIAHAAELNYRNPTHTLRVRELSAASVSGATDIYFEILVDGKPVRPPNIPHADSKSSDLLTIFGGMKVRLPDFDIPLRSGSSRVEINVLATGFMRGNVIGKATFELRPDDVGRTLTRSSTGFELSVELLPPVALSFSSREFGANRGYFAAVWLNMAPEHLKSVTAIRYEFADGSTAGFPVVNKHDSYHYVLHRWQPEKVVAQVTFASGSSLRLAAFLAPRSVQLSTPRDQAAQAQFAYLMGDYARALELVDAALAADPRLARGISMKASLLAATGKPLEALDLYERALNADATNPNFLNSYAWIVVEDVRKPSPALLAKARQRAEQAVQIMPDANFYDTLGWVHYASGDYMGAESALVRARDIQARVSKSSSVWQEISYHLGHVYLKLGKRREAESAFGEVLQYGKLYPAYTDAVRNKEADAEARLRSLRAL